MENVFEQHKPTKAERDARRAAQHEKAEAARLEKVSNIPEFVHGAPVVEMDYTAVGKKRVKELRRSFTKQRDAFLKMLATTQVTQLKAAGLSDSAIELMKKGRSPSGYNVHHKQPLAGGGQNEFSNFILIKNEPYHSDFHKVSDLQLQKIAEGETRRIKIPMPAGNVFISPEVQKQMIQAKIATKANSR